MDVIGIELADHKFFPLMDENAVTRRRVILTTARDNQDRADIRIGQTRGDSDSRFHSLGVISLTDLPPRRSGESELELRIQLNEQRVLNAEARSRETGDFRSVSIALDDVDHGGYSVPPALTEDIEADITAAREPEEPPEPARRRTPLLIAIVMLILLLVALGAVLFFTGVIGGERTTQTVAPATGAPATGAPAAEQVPSASSEAPVASNEAPAPAGETTAAPSDAPTAVDAPSASAERAADDTAGSAAARQPATPPVTAAANSEPYTIRWGDTLWTISEQTYGTPWLFPELAAFNDIRNPDLIFAEEDLRLPSILNGATSE